MNKGLHIISLVVALSLSVPFVTARGTNNNDEYDILYYVSAAKHFDKFSLAAYTEFTIDYMAPSLLYDYSLLGLKYNILPWLDAALYGGYMESGKTRKWVHICQLVQTFGRGNTKLWFSEKGCHRRDIDAGTDEGLLRLRGNVQYRIPDTSVSPFMSSETYLWNDWKRTNIHAGIRLALTNSVTLSTYYMASVRPTLTKHFLVLGLSINI